MNFKKFLTGPNPLNVAVHLQRADEIVAKTSRPVLLSDEENQHTLEIRSLCERRAFIAGRGLVQQVPSATVDGAPEPVPILRQTSGEPGVLGPGIQYHIAQCEDWCAVAWSAESAVGVAVEVIRPVPSMKDIVSDFFPPAAQRAFHTAQANYKTQVFFHWWAQIEAALKASEKGLDDSYECLNEVMHRACDAVPGVALAVAVVGTGPLTITWHLP